MPARADWGDMQDNRTVVTLAGNDFEIEASLGAGKTYADEFFGKLELPYKGALMEDMVELMKHVEGYALPDKNSPNGFTVVKGVDALDTETVDHLLDLTWAMARAAGSVSDDYAAWKERMEHASVSFFEMSALYQAIIHRLGDGATFRLPKGLADALASDEGEAD